MNEFALPENLARDLYRQQGAEQERERIIALLEATPATRTTMMEDGISVYALDKDDFIALIKGEQ